MIPVLLPGANTPLGFLAQCTWVDRRSALGDPAAVATLAAAIRGEPPGPDARDRIARTLATMCPYRGLLHLCKEDAPFFCGREAPIARLVEGVYAERRAKALCALQVKVLPGELSAHPGSYRGGPEGYRRAEALGTWAHRGRVCEPTGRNTCEARAGLESEVVSADPPA